MDNITSSNDKNGLSINHFLKRFCLSRKNSDNKLDRVLSKSIYAQSAMEYLMTYGWAILLIAVILVTFFELGIFNISGSSSGCVAQSSFLCSNPQLNTTGNVLVTFASRLSLLFA